MVSNSIQWSEGAQTWRFQGPADIQIDDYFRRFSVLIQVYHLTLQVQQVCSMSPSAPGINVQGRQGFRRALQMQRGRDQKSIQFVRFESEPATVRMFTNHFCWSQAAAGPVRQELWLERRDWGALWHRGNFDNFLQLDSCVQLAHLCAHSHVALRDGRTELSNAFIERHLQDIGVCDFNISIWIPVSGGIFSHNHTILSDVGVLVQNALLPGPHTRLLFSTNRQC